jgi:hypothetical protein
MFLLSNIKIDERLKYALTSGVWRINKKPKNQMLDRLNYLQHISKMQICKEIKEPLDFLDNDLDLTLTKETDYNEPD